MNQVTNNDLWQDVEITVDSGAADNVCPLGWAETFGMVPVEANDRINFVGAPMIFLLNSNVGFSTLIRSMPMPLSIEVLQSDQNLHCVAGFAS